MSRTFYIADDHELLRIGTISYIEKKSDWLCKGNADSPKAALSDLELLSIGNTLPDLVISDLNFSGDDAGFDFISKLHSLYPDLKIIVYSMFFSAGMVQTALENGATGYISKNAPSTELLECMENAFSGKTFIQKDLQENLSKFNSFTDALTRREKQVMALIIKNCSNLQISETLNIRQRAVENYISSIYEKTGINDKKEFIKRFGKM
ncbi:MAG: response regulator transcription factor [Treponema sp.]|nr:response regulator transcription factor [Treponema sp.]